MQVLVDGLMTEGVDLTSKDEQGRTFLHAAVRRNSSKFINIARVLLENEAKTEVRDRAGDVPVEIALREEGDDMASLLIGKMSKPG